MLQSKINFKRLFRIFLNYQASLFGIESGFNFDNIKRKQPLR